MGFYNVRRCELFFEDNLIVVFMLIDKVKEIKIVDVVTVAIPGLIVIGFCYKYGFYASPKVKAEWVLSLFSPVDFITAQLNLYIYYLSSIIYLDKIVDGTKNLKAGVLQANLLMLAGFMASFLYLGKEAYEFYAYIFFSFNSIAYILFTENIIGRIFGLLIVLIFIPLIAGSQIASKIDSNYLPSVKLPKKMEVVDEWYLLDKFSDKAILIDLDGKLLKIIELKEIEYIKK